MVSALWAMLGEECCGRVAWTSSPVYPTILVSYVPMVSALWTMLGEEPPVVSYVHMVSALWAMLGEECCGRVASLDLFSSIPNDISILRPYGLCPLGDAWRRALWQGGLPGPLLQYTILLNAIVLGKFHRYVSTFASDADCKDWNFLNYLRYLKDYAEFQFTSDSKQDILDAFIKVFKRIGEYGTNREKRKAKKIHDTAKAVFQTKEISEFFEELDREFSERRLERSLENNGGELLTNSCNFQTLNHSLRFKKRTAELKRKYETEDETSETSCEPKSYKIRSSESNISTTLVESEVMSRSSSSDQTYDSPSDFEGSIKAKRSFYLDYFIGPGEIDWELKEDSTVKCKSKEILSTDEELALNHIFLFQEENPQGLYEYFDDESWKCVFSEIRTQYPYISAPELSLICVEQL
ncbi:13787_t:CDS:2 [Acaulospora morrowiae]|uniref:13787_t:CDS:1 n=1 Tax=Acaulospora morrowiae TaxID=94023 RepID=A0A9N9EYE0_9GLOM|nr:13787_t:CDS:2 [Acaulospora morrowiae]